MRLLLAVMLGILWCCLESLPAGAANIRSLPVPLVTIYPGQPITASQLGERQFRTTATSLNGIATEFAEVTGREARRRLPVGKPIPLSVLQTPMAVRRGTTALVTYRENGVSISMPVTILQDGTVGAIIDARNMTTGAVIRVIVMAGGGVQVAQE